MRLLEFCLAVPTDQFLQNGLPRALAHRALADRLPKQVLEERRRGLQAADWHEHLTAARVQSGKSLIVSSSNQAAARALDLPRLRKLVEDWPSSGWEQNEVIMRYRHALLRGIAAGHFLRRVAGSN